MNVLQRWWQAPQTHWLRRALFQVHLWSGVAFCAYVLLVSLSGSALLLKYRFYEWFEPKMLSEVPAADAKPLEGEALQKRMAEVYAGYELGFAMESMDREKATYIVLNKDGQFYPHYFNQFTGQDQGVANPWPVKSIEWLADSHRDLYLGRKGRQVNGIGGALFVLMALTGLILWWQGKSRWYEGFIINPWSQRSLWWQLHTFLGFWGLLLMVAWGVSGFQLGFPQEMNKLVAWFSEPAAGDPRLGGNSLLRFFRAVHFARYGDSAFTRWCWIIVSFIPTVLVISGLWVWWKRVVLRAWQRLRSPSVRAAG